VRGRHDKLTESLAEADYSALKSTQRFFAANASFALCVGFGFAAAATLPVPGLRNFNGAVALMFGLAVCLLKSGPGCQDTAGSRDPQLATEPSSPTIDYSIVIPVYNRPQFVQSILRRLCEQTELLLNLGRGEIVIVDDGSNDNTLEVANAIAATIPIPTRVVSIVHSGPGAARNAGFVHARGTICVSIDSDCLPDADWLPGLLAEVRGQPSTVAFARIRSASKYAYPIENMPDSRGFVSASFAMDRLSFCKLGGFYPKYGMSHEDYDLVEVLKRSGHRVVRAESHIMHPLRRETPASIWRVGLNSRYGNLFARRHGPIAQRITRSTPYYFFGVAGNYGSSIAMLVATANLVATIALISASGSLDDRERRYCAKLVAAGAVLYPAALALLGLRVGAGLRQLPLYVATMASFQTATLFGRIRGSLEYRLLLL